MKIYYQSQKRIKQGIGIGPELFQYQGFRIYWHFNTWAHFSLGFHIDFSSPNVEIHLPGGYLFLGWKRIR